MGCLLLSFKCDFINYFKGNKRSYWCIITVYCANMSMRKCNLKLELVIIFSVHPWINSVGPHIHKISALYSLDLSRNEDHACLWHPMNSANVDSPCEVAFMATSIIYWIMKLSKWVGRVQKLHYTAIVQLFLLTGYSQKFLMSWLKYGRWWLGCSKTKRPSDFH